ncbi:XRE family transcriptional regulator [Xanthomonas sp. LMG 8993]|uniref:helix-turn-helix domain-containing protein n=1 Tax=Xanthomonas TaxID=338 RepID=UPI00136F0D6E|nr:helix-turn-helix transcriptional regulator [Xanthomonas arboricola]MBB4767674.1 transcriptional regulator with XRE-family HTH domain [Xanthomonas arboricola]MXV48117.1 XRE family transcriptional regulator [Xanthomonas sp. LMG 8993]
MNESKSRTQLGDRLKQSREYLGLSQDEVALVLNMPRQLIDLMESGGRNIEDAELSRFAKLYRVGVEYLLLGREVESKAPTQFAFLARAVKGLSDSDLQEVARFAEFLKNNQK